MKKIMYALIFYGLSLQAQALTDFIQNFTLNDVEVNIKYHGESAIACKPDNFRVPQLRKQEIKPGFCCYKSVQFKALAGPAQGSIKEYSNAFWCRKVRFEVHETSGPAGKTQLAIEVYINNELVQKF